MRAIALVALALAGLALAGCGSSGTHGGETATTGGATTSTQPAPAGTATPTGTAPGPSPLQGEAASASAGDIPDNQVFIAFRNDGAGYSIKYPEGWAQQGGGKSVTFRDKNNIARVIVRPGGPRGVTQIRNELRKVRLQHAPQPLTLAGSPAFKVVYTTVSAPSPVTGKRVTLVVDRYYLPHGSEEAVVDLGTPVGVDNVDAYRLMIQSFRWR